MNIWGATDIGITRETNQDAYKFEFLSKNNNQLAVVVCDGMGGANAGNVASTIAVDAFFKNIKLSIKPHMSKEYVQSTIIDSVSKANELVYDTSKSDVQFSGMGTTLVATFISADTAVVANIGDSRCYHIGEKGIIQITKDHSLVAHLVEKGRLTETEALTHPNKNLITRALGAEKQVVTDVFSFGVTKGEYLLLCTDGLTNCVSEQEILYEVLHGEKCEDCCDRLIAIANARGGLDNITVALVEV